MLDKEKNTKKAELAKSIAKKYDLSELVNNFEKFILINNEYKVKMLMIGGYSAGKSALLNKFIGKSVLIENQGPATDIATELHFSENEHIIAKMIDGDKKEIDSIEGLDIDKALNIEYYLNSDNLKRIKDYTLVDTPGVDSGIERHNKALMQYIDKGTVFFLVIDCERGTIPDSILNFINEATNYSEDIAVIINKCDKKTPSAVEEVKVHIEGILEYNTDKKIPIICTSIYDENVVAKLESLIGGFNDQELYDKKISSILNMESKTLIKELEVIKSKEVCETAELEEEIERRNIAKRRLLEQLDMQKAKIGRQLDGEVKGKILSRVREQLMTNVEVLADAYKSGIDIFKECIIDIIRPILIKEVEAYSSTAYENVIKYMKHNTPSIKDNNEEVMAVIDNVYAKLKDMIFGDNVWLSLNKKDDGKELLDKGINSYKAITSILAIATDAISPILELIIIYLPNVVKFFNDIFGKSREEQIIEAMQDEVIPNIISKLSEELNNNLSSVETVMFDNISGSIEEILNIENSTLEVVINKKKELESKYSEFIKSIEKDITTLKEQK